MENSSEYLIYIVRPALRREFCTLGANSWRFVRKFIRTGEGYKEVR